MDENGWSLARRLQSWPPPSLSRAIADAGSSDASPTFVARQPIYDRRLDVFGYEMLFRAADVVLAPGAVPSDELADRLRTHVREATAPYTYPRSLRFVEELPRTTTGKVRRAAIRAELAGA